MRCLANSTELERLFKTTCWSTGGCRANRTQSESNAWTTSQALASHEGRPRRELNWFIRQRTPLEVFLGFEVFSRDIFGLPTSFGPSSSSVVFGWCLFCLKLLDQKELENQEERILICFQYQAPFLSIFLVTDAKNNFCRDCNVVDNPVGLCSPSNFPVLRPACRLLSNPLSIR